VTETKAKYEVETYPVIAGGTSLLSKSAALKPEDCPTFVRGAGSLVYAEDGRAAVDWECGLLSILLGHAHIKVDAAVARAMGRGITSLPLGHPLEREAAELLLDLSGCQGQQVRWCVTGTAANTAAVRVARAITGRDVVVSIGYHGIDDWALAHTPPAWGVPAAAKQLTVPAAFNDLAAVERAFYGLDPGEERLNAEHADLHGGKIAAVVVEPVTTEEPKPGYLEGLRRLCSRYGAALIFDECITAGRYPEFTAARHYGVEPDLWVTSKCLANGLPLAAVVGRREWMRAFDLDFRPEWATGGAGPTYVSGTFHVPGLSLAACVATLAAWREENVGAHLYLTGNRLRIGLAVAVDFHGMGEHVRLKGTPYRIALDFSDLTVKTFVLRKMLSRGHLLAASGMNLCAAHDQEDVESAIKAWSATLRELKQALADGTVAEQAGRPVVQVYRQN